MKSILIILIITVSTKFTFSSEELACEPASCNNIRIVPAINCSRTDFCNATKNFCGILNSSKVKYPSLFSYKDVKIDCNLKDSFEVTRDGNLTVGTQSTLLNFENLLKRNLKINGRIFKSENVSLSNTIEIANRINSVIQSLKSTNSYITFPNTFIISNDKESNVSTRNIFWDITDHHLEILIKEIASSTLLVDNIEIKISKTLEKESDGANAFQYAMNRLQKIVLSKEIDYSCFHTIRVGDALENDSVSNSVLGIMWHYDLDLLLTIIDNACYEIDKKK